ncbi:MAG: N-formylglutamate amidohydrolase [Geminicoccaceae bacterium]|nr:N-formylglutamate amidohydrolase [Geminicoccaceae bacterium]MCX8099873.1 N-formylglutamate amidohydrolase [Geminicoccaceae bacterium]
MTCATIRLGPWVELVNPDGRLEVLLLADHAGNAVPAELDDLGLPAEERARHIAFDIGIAPLARRLAALLDAPALLNGCSRLVIDPNRRPGEPSSIPERSDGTLVPGNLGLDPAARAERVRRFFLPWHRAIARRIAAARRVGIFPVLLSLHSFTPRLGGVDRPWQVGVLWRGDDRLARPMLNALRARGDLVVGDNEPYSGKDAFGYTVEFHAQRTRLPHLMLEIRQDEIDTVAKAEAWASLLAGHLQPLLARALSLGLWEGPTLPRSWKHPTGGGSSRQARHDRS